ncbi:MAG: M48 family metallopeptidase [Terriglobales bacterium]
MAIGLWSAAAAVAMVAAAGAQTPPPQTASAAQKDSGSYDGVPTADKATAKKLKAEDNVALIGHRDVGKGLDFYSQQKEIALGRGLADQVMQDSKVITDPVVNEYINRLAQNLVRNSDAKVPFTVHVLQDDSVNAFALPGGFFFVNSGLILNSQEEDELAGAMAHEIAHVAARHGTRNATKAELLQIAAIPAVILAGPGLAGMAAEQGANLGIPLTYQHYSRGAEQEADWLGVQYLWKAGYDPQGLARAFEVIEAQEKQKPGIISRMFASHPQTPDRVALTEKEIATILPARPDYIVTTSDFQTVQARLRALLKSKIETGVKVPGGAVVAEPTKPAGPPVIKH